MRLFGYKKVFQKSNQDSKTKLFGAYKNNIYFKNSEKLFKKI